MNVKEIFSKSKHRKIEIFSFFFIIQVTLLSIIVSIAMFGSYRQAKEKEKSTSLYTTKVAFSKTKIDGKVDKIVKSDDGKKVLVLLSFADPSQIGQLSDDYTAFLTKADKFGKLSPLNYKPRGGVIVFGSTGKIGVIMLNESGFENHVHSLVLRSDVELKEENGKFVRSTVGSGSTTATIEEKKKSLVVDKSFEKYDQIQVFFNPGVDDIEVSSLLTDDNIKKPYVLYEELVARSEESKIKEDLEYQVEKMRIALNQITEQEKRLRNLGITVPDRPSVIAGDEVVKESDDKRVFTYKPNYQLIKGYNFDFRQGSVKQGYVKEVVKAEIERIKALGLNLPVFENINLDNFGGSGVATSLDYNSFFTDKIKLANLLSENEKIGSQYVFTLEDGRTLESIKIGDVTDDYKEKDDSSKKLVEYWNNYFKLKKEYQEELLLKLLSLELTLGNVNKTATVNVSEDSLIVYGQNKKK